jgi:hypothetical protein
MNTVWTTHILVDRVTATADAVNRAVAATAAIDERFFGRDFTRLQRGRWGHARDVASSVDGRISLSGAYASSGDISGIYADALVRQLRTQGVTVVEIEPTEDDDG